jgi:two-component system cell cycle response regulator
MEFVAARPTPLLLLVDDQEATARSIESVLRPKGHVVLKAYTGRQALDLVSKVSPDTILVDLHLPDIDGVQLLRQLSESPTIHPTTPILATSGAPLGRADRLEAFGAGAWDVLSHPLDPNELILRIETLVRAKQEVDRVREQGLTDPTTGFYNVRGILQRTKEISADAARSARPVTCVAFGALQVSGEVPMEEEAAQAFAEELSRPIAEALRAVTRVSDTIGCLGPGEFVVVAPGTDRRGAVRLADRVLEAVETDLGRSGFGVTAEALSQVRAGFFSAATAEESSPEDLLLRATVALRKAQADGGSFRVRAYDA